MTPGTPGVEALILGAATRPVSAYVPGRHILTYPQLAGLDIESDNAETPNFTGKHLAGKAAVASKRGIIKNLNNSAADLTSGDWVVLNYHGNGVGVESFRSWLGSSPMNSLVVYQEDELTRLTGVNFKFQTMSEDYEDLRVGRTMRSISRKVYFPSDALLDNPSQTVEVDGPSYNGATKYSTYRLKDNPHVTPIGETDALASDYGSSALIHEYRGSDGTFVLTAANSLTLQKWVGVKLPTEVATAAGTTPIDIKDFPNASQTFTDGEGVNKTENLFPKPDPRAAEQILETDAQQLTVLSDPNVGLTLDTAQLGNQSSIKAAVYAGNRVLSTLGYQSSKAFRTYSSLWKFGYVPRYLKARGADPQDSADYADPSNYDIGMWKRVPKNVIINLNSYGQCKRLYLGRALITITEEGGITLQDAYGSQIVMSGGNIYLTAEHDVITNAGRNSVTIAGQDAATMAYRNIEGWADGGHMSLGSALETAIVGGASGHGGINIESRAVSTAANSGVFIKSNSRVTTIGHTVETKAVQGGLSLVSDKPILFKSSDYEVGTGSSYGMLSSEGIYFSGSSDGTAVAASLSIHGAYAPSLSVSGHVHGASFKALTGAAILKNIGISSGAAMRLRDSALKQTFINDYRSNTVKDRFNAAYAAKFLQSYAYGVPTINNDMFALPESEWQRRVAWQNTDAASGATLRTSSVWKTNTLRINPIAMRGDVTFTDTTYAVGSLPYPGYNVWSGGGFVAQDGLQTASSDYSLAPIKILAGEITPGSGYTDDVYTGQMLSVDSGTDGSGAAATITVVGGKVVAVEVTSGGSGYGADTVLTVSTLGSGGGSGFKFRMGKPAVSSFKNATLESSYRGI
jgi:hypothetical protein